MIGPLLSVMSPAGTRARLSILIFHRVLPSPDELLPDEMHAVRFRELCGWLPKWFNVMPLDEASKRLQQQSLPARALAITFDDGYADNHDVAMPILRQQGLSATFFVAAGFLDGGCMWNDTIVESIRRTTRTRLDLADAGLPDIGLLPLDTTAHRRHAIDQLIGACKYLPMAERQQAVAALCRAAGVDVPRGLMMKSEQVQGLVQEGMTIGGHTMNHPILARLPDDEARHEIVSGRRHLQALTQTPVSLFAYPNGRPGNDFHARHVAMARDAGFETAVTTAWGAANARSDLFQLPRFTPWDRSRWRFGARMANNLRIAG